MTKDKEIIVSTEEKLSITYLVDRFTLVGRGLDVFDVQHKASYSLVELKIGQDVHDYERLEDECNRALDYMNTHPEEVKQLHLVYCNHGSYVITPPEWDIIVTTCCKYHVHPHKCKNLGDMMNKLNEIFLNHYMPKPTVQRPAKTLTTCAKMLCMIRGVSPEQADHMAKHINQDLRQYYMFDDGEWIQASVYLIADSMINGYKKDGTPVKLAYDIKDALEGRK
jgi:hypothetical protein